MCFFLGNGKKGERNYFKVIIFLAVVIVVLTKWLWPNVIPFSMFHFLKLDDCTVVDLIKVSWLVLVWGVGMGFITIFLRKDIRNEYLEGNGNLFEGLSINLCAGIVEEICFRWLIFYGAIVGFKILDWLFFGCVGFGIFQWLQLNIMAPISNFLTLGFLHSVFFGPFGWAVGAAMLVSHGKFKDGGHMYRGVLGWINSWFFGAFMFYLLFQYGLFASIIVHFIYDLCIVFLYFHYLYIGAFIQVCRQENDD